MKKKLLLLFFIAVIFKSSSAQITGSDTVCAGYLYTFNASIAGADSFAWSYPGDWVVISGAGTSQIELLCTNYIGQVCVQGFDTAGNFLTQYCHDVNWGGGGNGWHIQLNQVSFCTCPTYTVEVIPDSGITCAGCGNGTVSPNLVFAVYNSSMTFMCLANGSDLIWTFSALPEDFYVHLIDTTFGIANAIFIGGGLCPGNINNSFDINCSYTVLPISCNPDTVCVGDTMFLQSTGGGFVSYSWNASSNITLLPPTGLDHIYGVVNAAGPLYISLDVYNFNNCHFLGELYPTYGCSNSISGDSIVCTGYTYNYSASIPGAVTYNWTIPNGWYNLAGQGTSSISATCNVSAGSICVEGFDSNSVSLGTQCINTQWGNGGAAGWDIYPPSFYYCTGQDRPVHFMIIPDTTGSGSCPGGCGSGTQIPNLIYGLYDSAIPYPQFIAEVDGSWITMPPVIATYQVFYVDVSAGYNFPDAVNISGGCGAAGINNTVTSNEVTPGPPTFIQSPDPVCIGDTVLITQTNTNVTNVSWSVFGGNVLSYPDTEQILIVITSAAPQISYEGMDESYFCNTAEGYQINMCTATITGDTVVCSGYTYNYSVIMPGAVTYNWTLPPGWYGLTGQGSSSISATCNINDGDICVEGFDANSNSLGTQCITTGWGNGSSQGWDVMPSGFSFCNGDYTPITPNIISNGTGTGSCPSGCGNGSLHQNLVYALYDPNQQFMGVVDGSTVIILPPYPFTYTVYYVDTTLGANIPGAVIISGGCGGAVVNNTITAVQIFPNLPAFIQSPDPACVGDTVLITQTENILTVNWVPDFGLTLLGNPASNQALVIITSSSAQITFNGLDGCISWAAYPVNIISCSSPTASFSSTINPICPGTCTGFNNLSSGATSYDWSFPGANPSSSTNTNPSNICYNLPGSYDVTLIATNAMGSDTLFIQNYITVYPYPPPQGILISGDTLFSNQGFVSYQWYHNGNSIPGATDYFYVASLSGDYNLISVDSNGCEVEAVYTGFMMDVRYIGGNNWSIFPNPVKENLVIKNLPFTQGVSVSVYDIIGKYISGLQYEAGENLQDSKLNVSSLVPGIYFIEVSSGEKIWRRKFIRE